MGPCLGIPAVYLGTGPPDPAPRTRRLGRRRKLNRFLASLALFDSWGGHFSDNPRAISEAMHRRHPAIGQCWVLADGVEGPPWAERVAPGGADHVAALERARFVVANNLVPAFEKAAGTTFLQTWHGTPLKRIGFELSDADRDYLAHLERERSKWDLLLSPSPAATPLLRRAFRYDGRVLATGYPRNDALVTGDRGGRRQVLYAPTFREAVRFDLRLDAAALADALGPDTHVLLRLHHFAPTAQLPSHPRVHDVTREPDDIRDLLVAANALVTDYSSVLFDFAVTGRPMVLFAPDLDAYRSRLALDYETTVPGPIVTTTEAVADALRRPAAPYEAFRRTWCPLDDGGAADRVVDALLA